ncbi:MAG: glycosyltransferase family 2 protein [Anaerolineales bacterium]|nr:glycosyltransferase family 2 protein [Anaerolineales bacterium]
MQDFFSILQTMSRPKPKRNRSYPTEKHRPHIDLRAPDQKKVGSDNGAGLVQETREIQLQVVMPVCNEGDSIADTIREWYKELSAQIRCELVVSEDGSRDNTKEILAAVAEELPMRLDMTDNRRGYAGAVVAALRNTKAPFVLAVDSDGQCDPKDFWPFWQRRHENDVVIGWRVKRRDTLPRKVMSYSFKLLHRLFFGMTTHDPSCPYVLINRQLLDRLLPELGSLTEGFWWEFIARATRAGARIQEQPITHRFRAAGSTVIFKPGRIPRIAWQNGFGLIRIWWQTRPRSRGQSPPAKRGDPLDGEILH